MGSSGGGSAVKTLLAEEEKRLFTPNKTDKPKTTPKKAEIIVEEEPEEIIEETPEEEPQEVVEVESVPEKVVVKGPVEVKPVKTVKKKGNRDKDVDGLMAKLGLDKLKPIHWILGGVGLVVLISLIGVVGRGNERRKLERRAERLRSGSTDVTASLRASMQGKKRGPRLK